MLDEVGQVFYDTMMGRGPKRIPHSEPWSCPDAVKYYLDLCNVLAYR